METEEQLKEERDKIVLGLEETYKRLVEYKRRIKSPLIMLKAGKIVAVEADKVDATTKYKRKAT